jgi:2-oxoglutarate ferredoxin oxidoreductase subunit beta
VEVISQCPTGYGKRNQMADPYDMLMWQKNNAVTSAKAKTLSEEELKGKFMIGKLHQDRTKPDFASCYQAVIDKAMAKSKDMQ